MTREEAIEKIEKYQCKRVGTVSESELEEALNMAIQALQQEPKLGKWEYKEIANSTIIGYWCDQCHIGTSKTYEFCPNCGARMESDAE